MFGLLVMLCSTTMCLTATPTVTYETADQCHMHAQHIQAQGLLMIDKGEVEPHTFTYKCVAFGKPI